MKFYIGIDGGATKTRCICVDEHINKVEYAEGAGSNPHVVGFEKSANILISLFQRVSENKIISFAVFGIAGCGRQNHADRLNDFISKVAVEEKIDTPLIRITSDVDIALEGAFSGKAGLILISGTGSILFGKNKKGEKFYIGGFGRIVGDGGSGYSIGRKGLDSAAKSMDRRIRSTLLLDYLINNFGIKNRDELINNVYTNNFDVASFAPYVIKAAYEKDKEAMKIIEQELCELEQHIIAAKQFFPETKIPLYLSGGILGEKNFFSDLFRQKIKSNHKEIQIKNAKFSAEIGAAILAQKFDRQTI